MKIKRILSVFLALILTLGLAACGGGTDEADGNGREYLCRGNAGNTGFFSE